jgi:signal transduction histidine kinase
VSDSLDQRVLIVAPTGRDASLAVRILTSAGIVAEALEPTSLETELARGAGALVIVEEALSRAGVERLAEFVGRQPLWSDLPIVIITAPLPTHATAQRLEQLMALLGNVTLIDRPMRTATLLATVRAALRARNRQYSARETLAALASQEQEARKRVEFEQHLIGIVSHDLRNPLQAILLSASSLLAREELDPRSVKFAVRIQRSSERAVRLIGDLLDFTEARLSGGIRIRRKPVDLEPVVRQVVEELEAAHPEGRLTLSVEGDTRGQWDVDRLAQVVTNLALNALKYGAADSPIRIALIGSPEEVVLSVHNRGPVIPDELRPRLFQPLERGSSAGAPGSRSIGLGLFIVRQIVEAHGGAITVESDERGTCFAIRLPRQAAEAPIRASGGGSGR